MLADSRIVMVGVSHRRTPLALREKLRVAPGEAAALVRTLAAGDGEALALSTCNRTELYLAHANADAAVRRAREALTRRGGVSFDVLLDEEAASHLFRVVAGLDSMVLGETEIVSQVRRAHRLATEAGTTGPMLDRLVAHALRAGRRARAETASSPAVADAAVEVAVRVLGDLCGVGAVVVGAGTVGARAAAGLRARGAAVTIATRSTDLVAAVAASDLVVGATSAKDAVLTAEDVGERERPLLLIDLAVPRDVDPRVAALPGCRLYDVDDLQALAPDTCAARSLDVERAEAIVQEETARFHEWRQSLAIAPLIASLHRRAEEIRLASLADAERELAGLTPHEREAVAALTTQLVARLLHSPTVELKRAAAGRDGALQVEALARLLSPAA